MEIAKYLCEFFFDSFSHWAGLFLICMALKSGSIIKINDNGKEK